MRLRSPLLYVFASIFLVGTQTGGLAADKKPTPPTAKDLVGVWVGFDSDLLTFTRLDLRADSTGFCASVPPQLEMEKSVLPLI